MARQIIPVSPQSQGLLDFSHPDVLGPMVSFLMLRRLNQRCPIYFASLLRPYVSRTVLNLVIPATITFENLLRFVSLQFQFISVSLIT
jgi:hypothetical protein